ncbi:MAG: hypothetical protein LBL92_07065 [Propionibacteriaceae bacterium]|nr:hypothetical protein [Propionibacteriaceae bacterium]
MTAVIHDHKTTSVRLSTHARDVLAQQASAAGLSLTGFLDQLAADFERQKIYQAHREAVQRQADDPEWAADVELWASTEQDGLDQ